MYKFNKITSINYEFTSLDFKLIVEEYTHIMDGCVSLYHIFFLTEKC